MSKEAIDAVIAAENEAKEREKLAGEAAQKTVSEATEDAKSRFEAARAASMNDANERLGEIEAQAASLLEKSRADAEADAAAETRAAEEHMADAVKLIIGELMKNADK